MRFGIVRFPGSCDDVDALQAAQRVGDAAILWHAEREVIELPELVLRPSGALGSSFFIPLSRLRIVLRHPISLGISQSEAELRVRVPLHGRFLVPLRRFPVILRDAASRFIQRTEGELRMRVPLSRRFLEPSPRIRAA